MRKTIVVWATATLLLFAAPVSFLNPQLLGASLPLAHDDDEDEEDETRFHTLSRLTISFAPDGTEITRYQSSLFSSFAHLMTEEELKQNVLTAFQTWTVHSAINVGLVSDNGEHEFGTAGATQGDLRFGDIRIGAVPMAGDVFAVAVPNADFVSGTWSGDLLFNSNANFTDANQFYAVALHEAGHALGLGHTTDLTSAMHPTALNSVPNTNDILELQSLYGLRADLDENDEDERNDTEEEATEIRNNGSVDGIIPLMNFGDIEDSNDVDYFAIEPNSDYRGPITFRLVSDKVSLLRGRMTVTDSEGNFYGTVESDSTTGTDIELTIPSTSDDFEYFAKIESVGDPENSFGSYGLVCTIEDNYLFGDDLIETALRSNLGDLDQGDIQDLFLNQFDSPILDDLHTDDTPATAMLLAPDEDVDLHSALRIKASISDETDVDFYRLTALNTVMSVRVTALKQFGLIPQISVFDLSLNPVNGSVKVNGNGELLVEFDGTVVDDDYYIAIAADQPGTLYGVGNYDMNVAFHDSTRELELLGTGRLSAQNRVETHTLYIARTQLFHFTFEAFEQNVETNATIWMSIISEDGDIRYRVATRPGQTRSAKSVMLRPGSYEIRCNIRVPQSTVRRRRVLSIPFVNYRIEGIGISDPTGPEIIDPTEDPFGPCEKGSSDFCYPGDRVTPRPFIVVDTDEVDLPPTSPPDPAWQNPNNWYWQLDWLG